jgi:iron(III) transport system substrate-binding protein
MLVDRRLLLLTGLVAWTAFALPTPVHAQQTLTKVEQLYAELGKLSPEERQKALEDGARKEGKFAFIHTWRGRLAQNHMRLFQKRYPFLKVEMSDMGSQDGAERLVAEETAGRHLTDAVSLAVPDMSELLKRNMAAINPSPAEDKIYPQYSAMKDPQHRWVTWYWSDYGISYNTDLVTADQAPHAWMDLCKPFFKGSVSFDPPTVRFIVGIFAMMGPKDAEAWFKCMGENQPIIQRGHTARMKLMLSGDHKAQGQNYLYVGLKTKSQNPKTPIGVAWEAGIMGWGSGIIINKNAPNPYAAALFADWTLTEESQKYTADEYRGPVAYKHPYMPDGVTLAVVREPATDAENERYMTLWNATISGHATVREGDGAE